MLERASFLVYDDDHDSSKTSACSTDAEHDDTCSDIIPDLECYTTCLMDLVPTIADALEKSSAADRLDVRKEVAQFRVSEPAWLSATLLRDKFPLANRAVIELLGEASWERYKRIRRCASGEEQGLDHADEEMSRPASSAFHDSGLGSSLPKSSEYAASFTSTASQRGGTSARVPPTPTEVTDGKPFSCHLCGKMVSGLKNRVDWK